MDAGLTKLEAQLEAALDELDRLNGPDVDQELIATRYQLCAQQAKVWSIQESLFLRQGNPAAALKAHKASMEAEQRALAAKKEQVADLLPEVMAILERQEAQAEALHEIPDGDFPDYDQSDEPQLTSFA